MLEYFIFTEPGLHGSAPRESKLKPPEPQISLLIADTPAVPPFPPPLPLCPIPAVPPSPPSPA